MMQHWKALARVLGVLCCLHSFPSWAAEPFSPNLDSEVTQEDFAEVPVESIQQFVQIYGLVKQNYVEEKSDEALFLQAIKGLVGGLDRYSRYLSAEEYQQLLQYTEGDLATADFSLRYDAQHHQWQIQNLKEAADASKQGLRNGVVVYKIDHQELTELNHAQVQELLMGAIGSSMSVQLGPNSPPISVVRNKKIEADIQATLLHNQVLVIKVKVFQQDTANQIKQLIEEHSSNRLKAVLIDLRNNPGGLLSAAIESADLFLNQGIIVSTKSRSEGDQQFQALPSNELQNLKLGILLNHRSASAAEVFTAALKEHGRAWVLGEQSYGKGVVQKLFALPNGGALQMTVSHYYTPLGHMLEGQGVTPNQLYPIPAEMKDESYLDNVAELLLKHK